MNKRRQQRLILRGNQDSDHEDEMFYSLAEHDNEVDPTPVLSQTNNKNLTNHAQETQIENINIRGADLTLTLNNEQITTEEENPSSDLLFHIITCTFLTFSFIIAMSVDNLGKVLGIVGATGSTIVSYILPGAVYIKLHSKPHSLKAFAYVQLILGCIIVPIALYFVIFKGGRG